MNNVMYVSLHRSADSAHGQVTDYRCDRVLVSMKQVEIFISQGHYLINSRILSEGSSNLHVHDASDLL